MSVGGLQRERSDGSDRKSSKLASEDEARGFIKGLRVCGLDTQIRLWRLNEDGERERVQIARAVEG